MAARMSRKTTILIHFGRRRFFLSANLFRAGWLRVSLEPEELGIYKSVTYEIFKRRPYILIGLDGNSAALNMIQDAKNAKYRSPIFLYGKVRAFKVKAASLSGYIRLFDHADDVLQQIQTAQENNNSH